MMETNKVRSALAGVVVCFLGLSAMTSAGAADESRAAATASGAHDFDFNLGTWHTHIKRLVHPLSDSTETIELDGTVTVRGVWQNRAQLEEIEADGPNGHWEGLTLFLYNPQTHQWNQSYANSKSGELVRPLTGAFKNGRGELYAEDTLDGRVILVRGVWSDVTPNAHRFEESYSDDGGQHWQAVFSASLTRVAS